MSVRDANVARTVDLVRQLDASRIARGIRLLEEHELHRLVTVLENQAAGVAIVESVGVWGSVCAACGNATPDSDHCDACRSSADTYPLYFSPADRDRAYGVTR